MSAIWDGLYCALWTPTDGDNRLLRDALRDNLTFLHTRGVRGLLALGSTGEFLHLDVPQRKEMIQLLADIAKPMRLMINISDIRPAVVADLGRFSRAHGADAVSLLPPYFYPMAQSDVVDFFVRAGEASGLPLFLYNFPERTGIRLSLETIQAVADRVQVAGVKQSGSEFAYHAQLVELGRTKNFVVLTGADTRLREAVPMGVAGCVSGLSNAVPDLVLQTLTATKRQLSEAEQLGERLIELSQQLADLAFPLDVAAMMQARGLVTGAFKRIVSAETERRFRSAVAALRTRFEQWGMV